MDSQDWLTYVIGGLVESQNLSGSRLSAAFGIRPVSLSQVCLNG